MGKKKYNGMITCGQDKISLHLCGARSIAKTFGVSRSTVSAWKEAGAPILQIGKTYQASYAELWSWLKDNGKEFFGYL